MEIRVLPESIIASAPDSNLLSSYFKGKNKKKVCIKPTSPLMVQGNNFLYVVKDAPMPLNDMIKIQVYPPRKIAVHELSDYDSSLLSLMNELAHHGLHALGRPFMIHGKKEEIAIEID